jgi:hypothetical protein
MERIRRESCPGSYEKSEFQRKNDQENQMQQRSSRISTEKYPLDLAIKF